MCGGSSFAPRSRLPMRLSSEPRPSRRRGRAVHGQRGRVDEVDDAGHLERTDAAVPAVFTPAIAAPAGMRIVPTLKTDSPRAVPGSSAHLSHAMSALPVFRAASSALALKSRTSWGRNPPPPNASMPWSAQRTGPRIAEFIAPDATSSPRLPHAAP